MTKYQPLIDYYNTAVIILQDYLIDKAPYLSLSDAPKSYATTNYRNYKAYSIAISTKVSWPIDHDELLDTLAHEIAHIFMPTDDKIFKKFHQAITTHFRQILQENWPKEKDAHTSA